jgi:hypothetical protein
MTNLVDTLNEWRALALYSDKSLGLGFVAANHSKTDIIELIPDTKYKIEWWNIDFGGWSISSYGTTDSEGKLIIPNKPGIKGWAFRISKVN